MKTLTKIQSSVHPSKDKIAIEHLRAQKQSREKELRDNGLEAGTEYVLNIEQDDGVYEEMERLSQLTIGGKEEPTNLEGLMAAMACDDGIWFYDTYGHDADQESWVAGFVDGAVAKFNQLKARL